MNVSEEEARKLLARVKSTSERARMAQLEMLNVADARAEAVRKALDAGIPRDRIADAAGVKRTAIYRIAGN